MIHGITFINFCQESSNYLEIFISGSMNPAGTVVVATSRNDQVPGTTLGAEENTINGTDDGPTIRTIAPDAFASFLGFTLEFHGIPQSKLQDTKIRKESQPNCI
jgi:hypothetical protein